MSGAAVLAALTAGAALGFLVHNFHPASVFMGDAGANLLGYLLGVVAVIGSLKTDAVVALLVPLVILAVPVLDTAFVVAKRLKYGRMPWSADANHFHHRMARIGFSQRKTVAYLYIWTALLALLAVALRFVRSIATTIRPLVRAARRARRGRAGGERLPGVRARDLQAPGLIRAVDASCATPTRTTSEHEIDAQVRARHRDGRVRSRADRVTVEKANLDALRSFITADGSSIRELAGPIVDAARAQSLAEATVDPGRRDRRALPPAHRGAVPTSCPAPAACGSASRSGRRAPGTAS